MRQTPSRVVWSVIEAAIYKNHIHKKDLADRIGVHQNTVTNDSKDPDRIPLGRIWLYCDALGIKTDSFVKSLSSSIADHT